MPGLPIAAEDLEILEDGFVYFWPEDYLKGAFSAHDLREIADKLDELNKDWEDQIAQM